MDYKIILVTDPQAQIEDQEVPVYGMVNFRKSEITIADDLSPAQQWQCLLHELLHIIFEQLGLEEPGEGQIDSIAYLLLGVLMDNGFLEQLDTFPTLESSSE